MSLEQSALSVREFVRKRVLIETYGCQMNLADSELLLGILATAGFDQTQDLSAADLILLNTCAVREKAEKRIFGRLANLHILKRRRPDLLVGVTGCMAEHLQAAIRDQAPWVDLLVGPDAYRRFPSLVARAEFEQVTETTLDRTECYEGLSPLHGAGPNAWITVQRGCDKFCSFCIVPYVRGRERAVPPGEVVRRTEELAATGASSVTLLGQTVNSYRYDDIDFAQLLEAVAAVEGIHRIRFTSPHPVHFSPGLVSVMAEQEAVCPQVHLPLQSASNRVLKAMRRRHDFASFVELVGELREHIPGIAISTDLLVGFPGETREDFQETLQALDTLRFDSAYMFAYSARSGTYAAKKLGDDVSAETKQRRLARIILVQEAISKEQYRQRIGTLQEVLIKGAAKRGEGLVGAAADGKTTIVEGKYEIGDYVRVQITDSTSHTLRGVGQEVVVPSRLRPKPC